MGKTRFGLPLPLLLVVAALATVVVRTAWICDDAYITLRCADLFVHGDGPNYNVGERVDGFTHPLWMLLLSGVYAVVRDGYWTACLLAFATTAAVVGLLARSVARNAVAATAGLVLCLFSRAFVDYSTSGLENPLSHLLLVAIFALDRSRWPPLRRLALQSLCAGLLMLNRLDLSLLVLPLLGGAAWKIWRELEAAPDSPTSSLRSRPRPRRRIALAALCGFALPALWIVFSLVYYGFPVPNTAYAKLATGVAAGDLWRQGGCYLLQMASHDRLTLAVIGVAVALAAFGRRSRDLPVAAGLLLYALYIASVGGDFMSGRLFTPPFVVAVCFIAGLESLARPRVALVAGAAAALVGLTVPAPVVLSGDDYGYSLEVSQRSNAHGISDERAFYYCLTGLLRSDAWSALKPKEPLHLHRPGPAADGPRVVVRGQIGIFGFGRGRDTFIVDFLALTDPLLARLPTFDPWDFRVGHYYRKIPEGYEESIGADRNLLKDPGLREFYDALRLITRGPLFTRERWRAIWKMNTGQYDHLIDRAAYVRKVRRSAARVEKPSIPR